MNLTLASGLTSLFVVVGCSNGTTETDGGSDGASPYTADVGGQGPVDAAPEGPAACVVPASATSVVGCQPSMTAPFSCTDLTTTFKLACTSSDPSNPSTPPPPSALGCNLMGNGLVDGGASLFYCCPCGM
jgi:hypothetical protein